MRRRTISLNMPVRDNDRIAYAKHIAACMAGSPWFPTPPVPIATLLAHIAELDAAQVSTLSGAHGTASARDAKLLVVHDDLKQLQTYVQTVAVGHGEDAEAVVASSGMSVKQSSGPSKPVFSVKQGKRSGSVRLSVRHPGIVASFDWQSSTDGIHWVDRERTVHAKLDVDGLTPGTRYAFRYRTLTRAGLSDWSDPIVLWVV
jgi:hypothetical protein